MAKNASNKTNANFKHKLSSPAKPWNSIAKIQRQVGPMRRWTVFLNCISRNTEIRIQGGLCGGGAYFSTVFLETQKSEYREVCLAVERISQLYFLKERNWNTGRSVWRRSVILNCISRNTEIRIQGVLFGGGASVTADKEVTALHLQETLSPAYTRVKENNRFEKHKSRKPTERYLLG